MQERPPPKNVILQEILIFPNLVRTQSITHIAPYTPGYFTPFLLPGISSATLLTPSPSDWSKFPGLKGCPEELSHRSGRHSDASSPHTALLWFEAKVETMIVVPSRNGMAFTSSPEGDLTGNWSGRIVGFLELPE